MSAPEIDELARSVGHAINNPLGALMLNLELALEALGEKTPLARDSLRRRVAEARGLLAEAQEAAECIRIIVMDLKLKARASTTKELAPRRRSSSPPPPLESSAPRGNATRVLIVDDDDLVARALTRALRDCEVAVALDGRSALARIAAGERFDVIVCDLMMPNMTGMDFHAALQSVAPEQVERMIFLSGGAVTTRAREFAATIPNLLLLEKPLDVQRLRDVVRSRKR